MAKRNSEITILPPKITIDGKDVPLHSLSPEWREQWAKRKTKEIAAIVNRHIRNNPAELSALMDYHKKLAAKAESGR